MRASIVFLVAIFLILSGATYVHAQNVLTTSLSLGARGAQVTLLQQMLNRDPDTRVANTGLGSPGNETDYFGPLTKGAVARFQTKYAVEVLSPVGLVQGNGYVGLYTRAKLNTLFTSIAATGNVSLPSVPPVATVPPIVVLPPTPTTPTPVSQNPNLKNIDAFLAAIDKVQAQNGASPEAIKIINQQIVKALSTTTDLRAAFLKTVGDSSRQSIKDNSFGGTVLATITQVFDSIFAPDHARAAAAIPFGGALIMSMTCEDSGNWLIAVEPLPPSYAAVLSYYPGTQAYLSYNIPYTTWLLGEYEPPGECVFGCPYCVTITTEGTITPMTGSSPM